VDELLFSFVAPLLLAMSLTRFRLGPDFIAAIFPPQKQGTIQRKKDKEVS
jgi:hypothetical protein